MKRLVFVILIFSLFCFTSCGGKVKDISKNFIMFSVSVNNNEIIQSVNFGVDSEKIREKSKNKDEYLLFLSNLIENVKKLRNDFFYTIALKYMENPIERYKINNSVKVSNVCYFSDSDSVGFNISFKSFDAWKFYHSNGQEQEKNDNGNIFIKKNVSQSEFVFSSKTIDGEMVGEKYKDIFITSANGLSFENKMQDYQPDFVYSYSSPYHNLRSNSDIKFSNSGSSYHVWKVEEEKLGEDNDIKIWYSEINYGLWYIVVLVIVLVPTGSLLLIFHIKSRRKRRVN